MASIAPTNRKSAAMRMKMLIENYLSAKKEGLREQYSIKLVNEDCYENFYIAVKPKTGIYKDQTHIISMSTTYGSGDDKYTYPMCAPLVKFETSVFHANISRCGSICLDILKDTKKWMPTYDFNAIIMNILLLFQEPNNNSPLNGEAARLYSECEKEYTKLVKKSTSVEECEKLRTICFEKFKSIADSTATKSFGNWAKWFPNLNTSSSTPTPNNIADVAETAELEEMLLAMKLEKERERSTSDNKDKPVEEKKTVSRFAKYQKK